MRRYAALIVLLFSTTITAQEGPRRAGAVAAEEAALIAEGWTALVRRDLTTASQRAVSAMARYPRSLAALQLAVEVDIEQGGATAALDEYERWLGGRTIEDPFIARRIALAVLREAAASTRDAAARTAALAALAAEGDQGAATAMDAAVKSGSRQEIELLTRRGQQAAVTSAIDAIGNPIPNKMSLIEAVGESKDARAIPTLLRLLQDPRPEHRAAAAESLGRLGATQAIPQIRPLLNETSGPPMVRMAAASALLRLGDDSGAELLQGWLSSPVAGMRAGAAKGLAPRPTPEWTATVAGLADDADPTIRIEAARLLSAVDPERARVTLDRLLADPDPAVRELAGAVVPVVASNDLSRLRSLLRVGSIARVRAADRLLELTR